MYAGCVYTASVSSLCVLWSYWFRRPVSLVPSIPSGSYVLPAFSPRNLALMQQWQRHDQCSSSRMKVRMHKSKLCCSPWPFLRCVLYKKRHLRESGHPRRAVRIATQNRTTCLQNGFQAFSFDRRPWIICNSFICLLPN